MTSPAGPTADELRRRLTESLLAVERADTALDRVAAAREARLTAERLEAAVLRDARAEKISWAKIGAAYGLTKQGAQQRFSAPIRALDETDGADG